MNNKDHRSNGDCSGILSWLSHSKQGDLDDLTLRQANSIQKYYLGPF